jgi:hypothetical protein
LLNRHSGAFPQLLENKLANDPDFFCEVIQLVYKSKKKEHELKELTKETEVIAENAWHLLFEWKTPPGTKKNNEFNAKCFVSWLERVKETCVRTGHLEVSLINIGNVLVHAPVDPNGLWIHTEIATALNDREHEYMRRGFRTGINNLRGAYWVDPTAKPEKDLAKQFQTKADEVENAGFQRFAVTLRGLADSYAKEADYIIMEHEKESNE